MKSLIIYFSHTGENYMENGIENITKGNTEKLVENLQSLTGASLFKVEPVEAYPYNYQECCDVAKEELSLDKRPALKNTLDNLDDYETIYIAGPVWWGHYPVAMFSLLEKLDFKDKKVYYLTTHEGSGLGSTLEDIKRFCKGATIVSGFECRGCRVDNSLETLKRVLNI